MNVPISAILSGTPIWVFVLLAYLIWIGLKRLRPGPRPLARIWITPAIFIVWGLIGLFRRPGDLSDVLWHWGAGAVAGGALGIAFTIPMQADRVRRWVLLPGSVLPLLRILIIFGAHYALRVAAAIHADSRDSLLAWDVVVSGASAGYFFGWSVRFWLAYQKAPAVDLAAAAAADTEKSAAPG